MNTTHRTLESLFEQIIARLDRIERRQGEAAVKEWYTIPEAAERLKLAVWTVRQACNQGRIRAEKQRFGRGGEGQWRIPHDEISRIQKEGLPPLERCPRPPRR